MKWPVSHGAESQAGGAVFVVYYVLYLENLSVSKAKHYTENQSLFTPLGLQVRRWRGAHAGLGGRRLRWPRLPQPNPVVVQPDSHNSDKTPAPLTTPAGPQSMSIVTTMEGVGEILRGGITL